MLSTVNGKTADIHILEPQEKIIPSTQQEWAELRLIFYQLDKLLHNFLHSENWSDIKWL